MNKSDATAFIAQLVSGNVADISLNARPGQYNAESNDPIPDVWDVSVLLASADQTVQAKTIYDAYKLWKSTTT